VPRLFHVTSSSNRESIMTHALDWTRMGAARGIAGSGRPGEDGVFLSRSEFDVGYFVEMNNTGGPVDVWAVDGSAVIVSASRGVDAFVNPEVVATLTADGRRRMLTGSAVFVLALVLIGGLLGAALPAHPNT
jgi:hypothetical protein